MKFNINRASWQIEEHDAALIKGMLVRGDKQHDIAAFFGVNSGRIAEIATDMKFAEVAPATESELPPSGVTLRLLPVLMRAVKISGEETVRGWLERLSNA